MNNFAKEFTEKFVNELSKYRSEEKAKGVQKYFKGALKNVIGCTSKECQNVTKEMIKFVKGKSYEEIIACTDAMLRTGIHEVQIEGFEVLYKSKIKGRDEETFEHAKKWFNEGLLNNWASVDLFCTHVLADCIENNEMLQGELFTWSSSEDNWIRRASAVTYVPHVRHGKFYDRVYQVADVLYKDKDEFVNKGLGWVLRDTAMADKARFEKFVENHKDIARITLRYAIEKFEKDERKVLLDCNK